MRAEVFRAVPALALLGAAAPMLAAAQEGIGPLASAPLIIATFLVGAISYPLGPGAGLSPRTTLVVMALAGSGALLAVQELLQIGESSKTVSRLVTEARKRAAEHPRVMALGPLSLIIAAFFLGTYVAAALGWLFGWPRWRVFIFSLTGFALASLVVAAVTTGAMRFAGI
ncbi:MAG: hypothetical protein HY556_06910 [Euryarchaeota archaeon]|nr:hypothetical protein [Euryarchaeota archaeon]